MSGSTSKICPECKEFLDLDLAANEYVCPGCGKRYDIDEWADKLKSGRQKNRKKSEVKEMANKKGKCSICGRDDVAIVGRGRCPACYPLDKRDEVAKAFRDEHPVGARRGKAHKHKNKQIVAVHTLEKETEKIVIDLDIEIRVHPVIVRE